MEKLCFDVYELGGAFTLPSTLALARKSVVTVGNFDGLHIGHTRLLSRTVALARERGSAAVAVTFDPHTRAVVFPELPLKLLTTFDEKITLMQKIGIDYVFIVKFDEIFRAMDAQDFVADILFGKLGAECWVMGEGHHVGRNLGEKNKNLHFACGKYNISMFTEPLFAAGGAAISSTRIRGLIDAGRICEAREMLGHPYLISANRSAGEKVATKLGFPTLNFKRPCAQKVLPPFGVYAAEIETVEGGGEKLIGALYFGNCPTYEGRDEHFEFHALEKVGGGGFENFREPKIGEVVHIWLHKFIRRSAAFENEDALKEQIAKDIEEIKLVKSQ